MDQADADAIESLFDRLAEVERRAGPRDADAEALIAHRSGANPGAPYRMAQTILAQELALDRAQGRIAELEARVAEAESGGGGFLAGLFGDRSRPRRAESRTGLHFGSAAPAGGFLGGAAQTALGVAGGVLLANALAGTLDSFEPEEFEDAPDPGDFDL